MYTKPMPRTNQATSHVWLGLATLGLVLLPKLAFAKDPEGLNAAFTKLEDGIAGTGVVIGKPFFQILLESTNFLLSLIAVLALATMVWGGIYYIIALGQDEKIQKAKKIILAAIIGIIIAGISFVIIATLKAVLAV